jgi:hypothetical protein
MGRPELLISVWPVLGQGLRVRRRRGDSPGPPTREPSSRRAEARSGPLKAHECARLDATSVKRGRDSAVEPPEG